MSGLTKINLAVQSGWRSSVQIICQVLSKIAFVVEDTFSFGDYTPEFNYFGMTTSAFTLFRARYLKIWKMLWVSIDFQTTLAAPLANFITITLPPGCTTAGASNVVQSFYAFQANASEALNAYSVGTQGYIAFTRPGGINYAAAATRIVTNGFLEVL